MHPPLRTDRQKHSFELEIAPRFVAETQRFWLDHIHWVPKFYLVCHVHDSVLGNAGSFIGLGHQPICISTAFKAPEIEAKLLLACTKVKGTDLMIHINF